MRLHHPVTDAVIEVPDDDACILAHRCAGWESGDGDPVVAVRTGPRLAALDAAVRALDLIDAGETKAANALLVHAVHHAGIESWELLAAARGH